MKKLTRFLSALLVLCMVLSLLPTVLAEEPAKLETELVATSKNMFKYGHLDLNISTEEFLRTFAYGDIVTVSFLGKSYDFPVCSNYDDVDSYAYLIRAASGKDVVTLAINYGQLGVVSGIIEAAPEGSDDKYVIKEGVTFPIAATVTLKEKGGYADELSVRQLNRTNNREDYSALTDEQFANFRKVTTTGIADGMLYRSSSPINPELGRNTYADKAAEQAGVKTFINLADTEAEATGYEGYAESYYSKQNHIFLDLPVAFTSREFKEGLAKGFRFLAENEGPYLVHCTEGKDRAGLTSAILECLMGASAEEVCADYVTTFRNYYSVVDGKQVALTEAQVAYLEGTILKNLALIFGIEDASTADLAAAATAYLKELGLTDAEIATIKANLNPTPVKTTMPALTEIDKYGDVRLSITSRELLNVGFDYADLVNVEFLGQKITVPVIPAYRYVGAREIGLVVWPDGSKPAELEVFNGSFADIFKLASKKTNEDNSYEWIAEEGVTFPVTVTITLASKGGYRDQYEVYDLVRTNDRADYAGLTDEQFANFRAVTTTGVGKGKLYRSSSPINPEIGRNGYADKAAEAYGIKTIMNLADNETKAKAYEGFADTYYSRQNVSFLGLGVDFLSDANRTGLAEGLRYFVKNEGPYLVHCNEGQDRAGFVSALLECLMGASLEEVKADYATTFCNYYGVEPGSSQYNTITGNIVKNLSTNFGVDTAVLSSVNLSELATVYIRGLGLTDEEIAALKENLGTVKHVDAAVASTGREGVEIPTYVTLPTDYNEKESYPLAVMLHGHGGNHNEWGGYDTISDGLGAKGIIVVTMDFPGCGASKESFQLNNLTNMKNDVVDVVNYMIDTYSIDISRIGGFGYSMGGRIILELVAENRIKFATLEMVAPAGDSELMKNLWGGAEAWEVMKAEAKEKGYYQITTIYGQVQQLGYQFFTDMEKYGSELIPTAAGKYDGNSLVVWATDDEAVPPVISSSVAEAFGSATINTYTNGHSYSFYGTDPYTVSTVNNACINYFVNELITRPSGIYGYVKAITEDGCLALALDAAELETSGYEPGAAIALEVGGKVFDAVYADASTQTKDGDLVLLNLKGELTLALKGGDLATEHQIATKKTNEDESFEWYYADGVEIPLAVNVLVNPFSDVASTEWYYAYIIAAARAGLVNGYEDGTFLPEGNLTRAEATTLLYRAAGSPEVEGKATYTDLPNAWYQDAIAWAEQNKIVNGVGDGKFEPEEYVTREQLVTMIWRLEGEKKVEKTLAGFEDTATVNTWAVNAFAWAIEEGIINGTTFSGMTGTYLAPQDNVTRAEAAKILVVYTAK